jgi:hypothetical protein
MPLLNFDASTVAPSVAMEPVPSGWYVATIGETELVPTTGDGLRLNYTVEIVEGPFKGRKAFDGFNIKNNSEKAVLFSQQMLSALCHAVGVIRVQTSEELHEKPVLVKLSLEAERTDANDPSKVYGARNQVKGFKNVNELGSVKLAGAEPAAQGTTPAAAKPAAGAPGWAAKPAKVAPPVANPPPAWGAPPAPAAPLPVPAPVAAPVAGPSATAKPKGPKGPAKKAAPAAPVVKYHVYISDDDMPEKTAEEVAAMLAAGMPADSMITPVGKEEWKTPSEYGIGQPVAATASPKPWG